MINVQSSALSFIGIIYALIRLPTTQPQKSEPTFPMNWTHKFNHTWILNHIEQFHNNKWTRWPLDEVIHQRKRTDWVSSSATEDGGMIFNEDNALISSHIEQFWTCKRTRWPLDEVFHKPKRTDWVSGTAVEDGWSDSLQRNSQKMLLFPSMVWEWQVYCSVFFLSMETLISLPRHQ